MCRKDLPDHIQAKVNRMFPYQGPIPAKNPYTFVPINPSDTSGEVSTPEGRVSLPPDWAGSGTLTFAMAGARSSGKSLYIAVVVKLLQQLVVAHGGTFRPADDYTKETYSEKYEQPLFEEMGLLGATPPAETENAYQKRPLIFDLGVHERVRPDNGDSFNQRIFIVFRDVAGEDLKEENFSDRRESLNFFRAADRIIFLFDPMAVPRIRHLLEGTVINNEVGEDDPTVVLRNVLEVLGEERYPTIAMTLSKFDTLQQLADVEQVGKHADGGQSVNWQKVMSNLGASFRREGASVEGKFSLTECELLHYEVESLLHCLGARELVNQLRNPMIGSEPYRHMYFVASALGSSPEGEAIARTGIAPFRCLDPIRELLAEVGLFQGKGDVNWYG